MATTTQNYVWDFRRYTQITTSNSKELEKVRYKHLTVNHIKNFVNSLSGAYTQNQLNGKTENITDII